MMIANIYQAKTQLSKLIREVIKGKEVIIAKADKPIAKLVPYIADKDLRKPGLWKNKVWISANFNDEDRKMNKLFYVNK
mgnify:CR=1 FL=1